MPLPWALCSCLEGRWDSWPCCPCPPPWPHCSPKGLPLTPCPLVPQLPQPGSSQPPRPCSPLPPAGLHGPCLVGHTPSLCPEGAWPCGHLAPLLPGPALGPALPLFCPGCQAPVRCEFAQSRRLPCAQARMSLPPPAAFPGPQLLPPPQAYLFKPLREHIEIYSPSSSQAHWGLAPGALCVCTGVGIAEFPRSRYELLRDPRGWPRRRHGCRTLLGTGGS